MAVKPIGNAAKEDDRNKPFDERPHDARLGQFIELICIDIGIKILHDTRHMPRADDRDDLLAV